MEDILYTNSVTDIRVREMVTKTESSKYKTNGYSYVDLGLPSGTLWATMNVGAQSETDFGLYFAWGETEGYPLQDGLLCADRSFVVNTYKYAEYSSKRQIWTMSKYSFLDSPEMLTQLTEEDDAVKVNMGGDWHMPTSAQLDELLNDEILTKEKVENYNNTDVKGLLITSKVNGNKLFFPYSGLVQDSLYPDFLTILSKDLAIASEDFKQALSLQSNNKTTLMEGESIRFYGYTMRGVIDNVQQEQEDDNSGIYNPQINPNQGSDEVAPGIEYGGNTNTGSEYAINPQPRP